MKLGSHAHSIVYQSGDKRVTKCNRCSRLPFALWANGVIVQWHKNYDVALRAFGVVH